MAYFLYLVIYLIAELCVENHSALVYPDENGRLVYKANIHGDFIPDFSNCGYKGGGVALPNVPVVKTVWPRFQGDDTERLRAAIDEVSALPMDANGFRGALLFKRGEYRVEGKLHIRTSGVVLRGEGDGVNGTVIIATGTSERKLITFSGIGNPAKVAGTRQAIVDDYVPVGARTFEVEDGSGFALDDSVIVHRPGTQEWIEELEMDHLDDPWKAVNYNLLFDRVVTKVEGNFVTLDAPLGNSLDHNYGGGWIYKYTFTGRIDQVGIENIRGVSEYDDSVTDNGGNFIHKDHANGFVGFIDVKNGWARNLTGAHFSYSCVSIKESKWVTVQDVQHLEPVSPITGGERYAFVLDGSPRDANSQLILFQRCYSLKGRHSFVLQGRIQGPNAFVDCVSDETHADEGPHRHWSTAALYDNVRGIVGNNNAKINVQNRKDSGTGHGWAGANIVLWNCDVNRMIVQKPPTAQNYAIGCKGDITNIGSWATEPAGYSESSGPNATHVYPRSLYYKQLEDRLGMDAVRAVATNEQIGRLMASKRVKDKIGQAQQGDFNRDGCIGFSDFLAFASHYGLREGQTGYNARYDLDGDKIIGFGDFLIFASHFG